MNARQLTNEEFRERIRAILGLPQIEIRNRANPLLVRQPTQPPKRKAQPK